MYEWLKTIGQKRMKQNLKNNYARICTEERGKSMRNLWGQPIYERETSRTQSRSPTHSAEKFNSIKLHFVHWLTCTGTWNSVFWFSVSHSRTQLVCSWEWHYCSGLRFRQATFRLLLAPWLRPHQVWFTQFCYAPPPSHFPVPALLPRCFAHTTPTQDTSAMFPNDGEEHPFDWGSTHSRVACQSSCFC
jgi:hypothetical protein